MRETTAELGSFSSLIVHLRNEIFLLTVIGKIAKEFTIFNDKSAEIIRTAADKHKTLNKKNKKKTHKIFFHFK